MGIGDRKGIDWFQKKVETVIRYGSDRDANYVKNIDLKSYPYPWTKDEWRDALGQKGSMWCVFLREAQPVGFGVWLEDEDSHEITIRRICVKPSERGAGYGTRLMQWIESDANRKGFTVASVAVPEIHCFPGHPDDVSAWLLRQNYCAEPPIIRDYAKMYGQTVDGFRFAKALGGSNE